MYTRRIKNRSFRYFSTLLAMLALISFVVGAQEKKSKPSAAKPAAPSAASRSASHGPSTAGHGPTTSRPGASTAGHGPTTGGRGPTTAGRGPSTAGRGPTTGRGSMDRGRAPMGGDRNRGMANNRAEGGRRMPAGSHMVRGRNGDEVRMRANGRPADVHVAGRGMDIHHGLDGSRRVSVERADHSRVVFDRRGRGYVQHPYMYRGHEFAHRTYYRNGRAYDHFYRRYPYHGVYVEAYAPAVYYRPAFYGWVYNPWPAPVAFSWGFAVNPWYGFYGGYFAPYPVYASAPLWLTDYLVSQSLADAYQNQLAAQAQAQAAASDNPPAPLTPEVKQEIADEVQRQIALENQGAQMNSQGNEPDPASTSIQRMLSDGVQHVFVAGANLDVTDGKGNECTVGEGDALQLTGPPAPDANSATLVMLSTKGGVECPKGDTVSVGFADLQDMQNHMRETIDAGMGTLQSDQGKGGLPAVPPSASAPPVKSDFASSAPPPDQDAGNQIDQEGQSANQAEQEAVSQTTQDNGAAEAPAPVPAPAAAPATISLGETVDQVTAAMGQPQKIVDLGTKKIYVYADMKVTFKGGKVSDVE